MKSIILGLCNAMVICLGFPLAHSIGIQKEENIGAVSILVLDTEGKTTREASIEVKGEAFSKRVQIETRGSLQVPYGMYLMTCRVAGYVTVRRLVTVDGPKKDVLFGMSFLEPEQHLGEGPSTPFDVWGIVVPPPGTGESVVAKLVGLYSEETQEAFLEKDGRFRFRVFRQGHYKVWVLRGGRISGESSLDLDITSPKTVRLTIRSR